MKTAVKEAVGRQVKPALGPIEPETLYPLTELQARSGFGATAMRSARRSGLNVVYAGGRGFCLGRDFIKWLMETGKSDKTAAHDATEVLIND